jgi:hypothetical protein
MPRPVRKLTPAEQEALARIRRAAAAFGDVEETLTFGNPTFKARGQAFAVLDRYGGRECLWMRVPAGERAEVLRRPGWFASPYDPHRQALCCDLKEFDWRRLGTRLRISYGLINAKNQGRSRPTARLAAFVSKFSPPDQRRIRAVRSALRAFFPTANELVWDNYNFFVIGYSPTERPSDAIVSMAARADGIGLCFIHGAALPDPKKLLLGSGRQTRFIRLESPQVLERPEVKALLQAAIAQARVPFASHGRGKLIIRSVSEKQRPRRKLVAAASARSSTR